MANHGPAHHALAALTPTARLSPPLTERSVIKTPTGGFMIYIKETKNPLWFKLKQIMY